MPTKMYQIYCDMCNWKKITDGTDLCDIVELKLSPIQKTLPKLDTETGKLVKGQTICQKKKFRCPKCGRAVLAKKITNPQQKIEEQREIEERMRKRREQEDKVDRFDGNKKSTERWTIQS